MTDAEPDDSEARDIGASLAMQLLLQALVAIIAEMAPDADVWRQKLFAQLKSQVLRSGAENLDDVQIASLTDSAIRTLDFVIFERDSEKAH
jgi:hypothetical protein